MDYITEGERLKLYYLGLKAAGNADQLAALYPDIIADLEDPELPQEYKAPNEFYLHIILPLYHKLAYIQNNRFIHEDLSLFEAVPQRIYTAKEIYTSLQSFAPFAVEELIRTIGCSSATMTRLYNAFSNQDEAAFIRTIDTSDCDLSLTSEICEYVWPTVIYKPDPAGEEIVNRLDAAASMLRTEQHPISRSSRKLSDAVEPFLDGGDEEPYLQTLTQYNHDVFDWLCEIYRDNYDRFKSKELKQLEPFILAGRGYVDNGFRLPDDYFSFRNESCKTEEYFGLHPDIIKAGPERFVQLLDYLAEAGYIDSTTEAKQLFAYRFSGRMRPAEVTTLEWHGRKGKSYELIYLVRNMTEKGNYRKFVKMRQFFTGPEWVEKSDSSYSTAAEWNFRIFLNKLYPTIPAQLKKLPIIDYNSKPKTKK